MYGFGSYRLKILLPETNRDYGIKLEEIGTAFQLFADGKKLAEGGKLADNPEEYRKDYKTRTVYFHPEKEAVEIIVNVCNYGDWVGGLIRKTKFGLREELQELTEPEKKP